MELKTKLMGAVIIVLLLVVFLQNGCNRELSPNDDVIKIDTNYVDYEIPEDIGSFEPIIPEPIIIRDTIEKEVIKYDTELLNKYRKENDSLKEIMYKNAIEINNYDETFEDENIRIGVTAQTLGSLRELGLNYTIKRKVVSVPEIVKIVNKKRLKIAVGADIALPLGLDAPISFMPRIEVDNTNNLRYSFGYDFQLDRVHGGLLIVF